MNRRGLLAAVGGLVSAGLGGCVSGIGGGDDTNGNTPTVASPSADISLSSSAFDDGASIPTKYTCDGADVSPPLSIDGVPDGTQSLAMIVDDPDAPSGTFTHWLLWDIPPDTRSVPEAIDRSETVARLDGATQGQNDFDALGYRGPCPPQDDDAHTYRFILQALEGSLALEAGADRDAFDDAMPETVLARTVLTGTYDR
ncbi:MAG: YbhB/YbcL family Raf kinase inhibitor-like protein [Halobacteriales archaeon]